MRKQQNQYQDFVIADLQRYLSSSRLRRLRWHFERLLRRKHPKRYHTTQVRRVAGNRIEVTLDLPPTIQQRMREAALAGKSIRMFVL